MRERGGESLTPLTDLAPPKGGGGGAGADAELSSGGGWNPSYNGRAHYWNTWLEDGEATAMAGVNYERLAVLTMAGGDAQKRAHHAAYLAHYIADPISAKHADAITLDPAPLEKLIEIANRWMTASWIDGPVDEIEEWIASPILTEAVVSFKIAHAHCRRAVRHGSTASIARSTSSEGPSSFSAVGGTRRGSTSPRAASARRSRAICTSSTPGRQWAR